MTTTSQTWVTPLQSLLTSAGVTTEDATLLAQTYLQAEPKSFLNGLDWVTNAYLTLSIPTSPPPDDEPWVTLAMGIIGAAVGDIENELNNAIGTLDVTLQSSVLAAITGHAAVLQTQQNQRAAQKRRAKSADYLKALADLGYEFRMNNLNDLVEVKTGGSWQTISDPLAKLIRRQMRDNGFEHVNVCEDVYISEAYLNRYHPVLDYLNGLQYDGGNYIEKVASFFTDVDQMFGAFLRRWLIGSVARVRASEQNRVLVMDGVQGLGKSHFVKWLARPLPDLYVEAPIDPSDKDAFVRLASKWLWEVSEFGVTMRKADREALKFFITMHRVTVRKAYAMFDMVKPALASFIGTFNNEQGALSDPTGNRRFMICHMTAIDWNYWALDPNHVWAEANAAYLAGEPWHLTAGEVIKANEINQRYEVDDSLDGLLKSLYRIHPNNTLLWTPTHEIVTGLENNGLKGGSTRQNAMALAALLTKLGCERSMRTTQHGQRVWGYLGVERI